MHIGHIFTIEIGVAEKKSGRHRVIRTPVVDVLISLLYNLCVTLIKVCVHEIFECLNTSRSSNLGDSHIISKTF